MQAPPCPNHPDDGTRVTAIARLIARRYGDGGVYLPRSSTGNATLRAAITAGYVSSEGFLTRKGRQLVARFET